MNVDKPEYKKYLEIKVGVYVCTYILYMCINKYRGVIYTNLRTTQLHSSMRWKAFLSEIYPINQD